MRSWDRRRDPKLVADRDGRIEKVAAGLQLANEEGEFGFGCRCRIAGDGRNVELRGRRRESRGASPLKFTKVLVLLTR